MPAAELYMGYGMASAPQADDEVRAHSRQPEDDEIRLHSRHRFRKQPPRPASAGGNVLSGSRGSGAAPPPALASRPQSSAAAYNYEQAPQTLTRREKPRLCGGWGGGDGRVQTSEDAKTEGGGGGGGGGGWFGWGKGKGARIC